MNPYRPAPKERSTFLTPFYVPPPRWPTTTVLAGSDPTVTHDAIKAARRDDVSALRRCMASEPFPGASVSARDEHGCTPLIAAASKGSRNALLYLISHGSDLSAHDRNSWTALHWCAYHGHLELLCHLIAAGAPLLAADAAGATAADWAGRRGHVAVVEALREPEDAKVFAGEALRKEPVEVSDYEVSSGDEGAASDGDDDDDDDDDEDEHNEDEDEDTEEDDAVVGDHDTGKKQERAAAPMPAPVTVSLVAPTPAPVLLYTDVREAEEEEEDYGDDEDDVDVDDDDEESTPYTVPPAARRSPSRSRSSVLSSIRIT